MLTREILFFGYPYVFACDGRCDKAWGTNSRPSLRLSVTDEDDWVWKADGELGQAPADPGTYECDEAKPRTSEERLNKWCVRECERGGRFEPGEEIKLSDFSRRVYNRNDRQAAA